jgi:hypothetical protein
VAFDFATVPITLLGATRRRSPMRAMTVDRLSVPDAELYYEVRGRGPALLMIPGGPTDASIFSELADQ